MIKVVKDDKYCCNNCMNKKKLPVYAVKTSMEDNTNYVGIGYCEDCLEKLQNKLQEITFGIHWRRGDIYDKD